MNATEINESEMDTEIGTEVMSKTYVLKLLFWSLWELKYELRKHIPY